MTRYKEAFKSITKLKRISEAITDSFILRT
jgi:hypothetical protein